MENTNKTKIITKLVYVHTATNPTPEPPTPTQPDYFDDGFFHFSKLEDDTYSISLNDTAYSYDGMYYNPSSDFDALTSLTVPATVTYEGETYNVTKIENNFFLGMSLYNLASFYIENGIKEIGTLGLTSDNTSTIEDYFNSVTPTTIPASVETVDTYAFQNFGVVVNSTSETFTLGSKFTLASDEEINASTDTDGNKFLYIGTDDTTLVGMIVNTAVTENRTIEIPSTFTTINSLDNQSSKTFSLAGNSNKLDLGSNITSIDSEVTVYSYTGTPAIIYKGVTYDDATEAATLNALLVSDNVTTNETFWQYSIE